MDGLPLTAFDLVVLGVVALSALLALARGATAEVLAAASWIGAFVVAYYGFGEVRAVLARTIETDLVADGLALLIAFAVPLVVLRAVTVALTRRVRESGLGRVDRAAGAALGLARGVLIVCLLYLALSVVVDPGDHPAWVREARTLPYVQRGVEVLHGLVPEDVEERGRAVAGEALDRAADGGIRGAAEAASRRFGIGSGPDGDAPAAHGDAAGGNGGFGYDASDLEAMERLIRRERQQPQGDGGG